MASTQHTTTIENLPTEILTDMIFIRLLAKQLAQMRCVSKSWKDFLSRSSFIETHLRSSIRNNDDILLFFHYNFSFHGDRSFTARPTRSPHLELTDFIKLPVHPQSPNTHGNVIGSVNGLICFTYGTIAEITYYIWNPSLSAVLTLPPSSSPSHDHDMVGIPPRFGYDPEEDDYKVVKVIRDPEPAKPLSSFSKRFLLGVDPKTVYKVEVYSMRKGFWQLIPQRFPSHIQLSMSMHANEFCADGHHGKLHWFDIAHSGHNSRVKTIVEFDLVEETFSVIPLPDFLRECYMEQVLGVLGGKLCVMLSVLGGDCEVWVMNNENGVAESWVKDRVFPQVDGGIVPYGFTLHNNEFLSEDANYHVDDDDDRSFSLYDPVADETKRFEIFHGSSKVVEYVDSLVWVAPVEREIECCSFSRLKI